MEIKWQDVVRRGKVLEDNSVSDNLGERRMRCISYEGDKYYLLQLNGEVKVFIKA